MKSYQMVVWLDCWIVEWWFCCLMSCFARDCSGCSRMHAQERTIKARAESCKRLLGMTLENQGAFSVDFGSFDAFGGSCSSTERPEAAECHRSIYANGVHLAPERPQGHPGRNLSQATPAPAGCGTWPACPPSDGFSLQPAPPGMIAAWFFHFSVSSFFCQKRACLCVHLFAHARSSLPGLGGVAGIFPGMNSWAMVGRPCRDLDSGYWRVWARM